MKLEQTERNQKIYQFWQQFGDRMTLEDVGQLFPSNGRPLTKQRVCQIVQRERRRAEQAKTATPA